MTKELPIADPPLITADELAQWETETKTYVENLKRLTHPEYSITTLFELQIDTIRFLESRKAKLVEALRKRTPAVSP